MEKVDGLVCIGKFSPEDRQKMIAICPNIIFLDMKLDTITNAFIVPDFKGAMRIVMDHFIAEGHKKVGFLGGIESVSGEVYLR